MLAVGTLLTYAQTVEEVMTKYEEVNGGKNRLKAIKTLQMESVMKMNMMNQSFDISLNSIRERGKLYRRQMGGIMGMGNSWTMVTDTAGYVLIPAMPNFGGPRGGGDGPATPSGPTISKMTEDDLRKQQHELDCAGPFPMLIDYAKKGYTAELQGTSKVNKEDCYKVKLNMKDGLSAIFYINTKNYLVQQVDATDEMAAALTGFGSMMRMMGGGRRSLKASIMYNSYKDIGGIQFPMKQIINIGPVETVIEHLDIKMNEPVDEVWYKVK
ncbi:hypothetical protein KACHI17_13600 [Sediminibacterium sp. KACHI17]|uniref:DUF4412 domain-containing protein n=2 Tax=Sediminibacterium sp. KACHI17 TaxID=1751071 RepID=A0AAT9GIM2_9BACT